MRDLDIRKILNKFLINKFKLSDPECIIRDEFGLCQGTARIDIAVINGHIHGYEIKSEQDTLNRVDGQLDVYTKTLDYLTFVTNRKHLEHLKKEIPSWCGLMVVESNLQLKVVRKPKINKSVDPDSLVQLLWKDEAIAILRQLGHKNGFSGKTRKVLWKKITTELSLQDLNKQIRKIIKSRPIYQSVL